MYILKQFFSRLPFFKLRSFVLANNNLLHDFKEENTKLRSFYFRGRDANRENHENNMFYSNYPMQSKNVNFKIQSGIRLLHSLHPPRTLPDQTYFHSWDVLKTIFDVNFVNNSTFDLERSTKVNFCKKCFNHFQSQCKIEQKSYHREYAQIISISLIVYQNRKFKVNKDKEGNTP